MFVSVSWTIFYWCLGNELLCICIYSYNLPFLFQSQPIIYPEIKITSSVVECSLICLSSVISNSGWTLVHQTLFKQFTILIPIQAIIRWFSTLFVMYTRKWPRKYLHIQIKLLFCPQRENPWLWTSFKYNCWCYT